MATIRIRALESGLSPAGERFLVEDADAAAPAAALAVRFCAWVIGFMSAYQNKGGVEQSSLFKSYVAECFEELQGEDPAAASLLTGLVVECGGLSDRVREDRGWLLHRAVLASLPGCRILE